jgi:hypothetical protein
MASVLVSLQVLKEHLFAESAHFVAAVFLLFAQDAEIGTGAFRILAVAWPMACMRSSKEVMLSTK